MGDNILHRIYLLILFLIVLLVATYLTFNGYDYYLSGIEHRFDHPNHQNLKPSGFAGHGFGIIGSLMMFVGVLIYTPKTNQNIFKNWHFKALARISHLPLFPGSNFGTLPHGI